RLCEAADGKLTPEETGRVLDHIALCPSCTLDWRLAVELGRLALWPAETTPPPLRWPDRPGFKRWLPLAAAAALALCLLPPHSSPPPPERPRPAGIERGGGGIVPEGAGRLPRDNFDLRWKGTDGATYQLQLRSGGRIIPGPSWELTVPRYRIPPSELASLSSNDKVCWKVTALRPNAPPLASQEFCTSVD
ncbi:MAG: zf-HC2 domain-containing protein, partial [Acidobacteriota bacterium]|nr:zf-HC2 domain-containing protein [Acidobacteriota bacterium]